MPDLRVGIVGPESSGKTTLAHALRGHVHASGLTTALIAEQGRLLAEQLPPGHRWSWREQQATSLMHQAEEARVSLILDQAPTATCVIADGTAATPLVWHMCAIKTRPHYNAGPPEVTEELLTAVERAEYDVVLLTAADLPWEPDGIRDDPDGRDDAFTIYQTLFPQAVVIAGDNRAQRAIEAVTAHLR